MKNISDIRKEWFVEQIEKLNDKGITNVEIAKRLDVVPQYITNITRGKRGAGEKFVSKLCEAFEINQNDLLNRLKTYHADPRKEIVSEPKITHRIESNENGIPLIPVEVIAGFVNGDALGVMNYDVKEHYLVPEFNERGVKYLIRVSGSSMYPSYTNGDVLACRPISDTTFFQWGKVYVLDTDQGPLVKRLFEAKNDASVECRSDNHEHFPAFEINKTSIRSISIVVGVIRLE